MRSYRGKYSGKESPETVCPYLAAFQEVYGRPGSLTDGIWTVAVISI